MTNTTYNDFYFEDLDGYTDRSFGEYELVKEEIIEFAKKWDPMIFHTDEEVAKTTPHGGLIAPGTFLLAIRIRLLHSGGVNRKVLASVGFEDVRFLKPAFVGQKLTLNIRFGTCQKYLLDVYTKFFVESGLKCFLSRGSGGKCGTFSCAFWKKY